MKLLSLITIFFIISCSHQKSERIDEVHLIQYSTNEMAKNIKDTREYVNQCNSISKKQKSAIIKFHEKRLSELGDLEEDLTRTRIILVKTLLEPKVDSKIAGMVRKEINRLEKVKTEKTLEAYIEAQSLITPIKDLSVREHLYNAFMFKGKVF